jgi:hypothetical protein
MLKREQTKIEIAAQVEALTAKMRRVAIIDEAWIVWRSRGGRLEFLAACPAACRFAKVTRKPRARWLGRWSRATSSAAR